jgi:hypothetical protein
MPLNRFEEPDMNDELSLNWTSDFFYAANLISLMTGTLFTWHYDVRGKKLFVNHVEVTLTEQQKAEKAYPNHHPNTALANYRAGREVWDSNGDLW